MRRAHVSLIVVLIISLALFAVGCAKKTVDKSEEVKPPVQQEVKVEQPAPPAPAAPEKPKEEAKVETPAPVPSLEDAMKAFEDKNIYFDFDKYSLQSEAKDVLKQKAEFLKTHSNITIQIEGHCDERGTTEYNLALGERRAKVAQDYMVSLGVAKERISTISYGEEKPVDPGHNEEAWSKNRRDHFVIVNK
jgi:peptidoglycan-associated lipoprotein